jgi:hypothetical protein
MTMMHYNPKKSVFSKSQKNKTNTERNDIANLRRQLQKNIVCNWRYRSKSKAYPHRCHQELQISGALMRRPPLAEMDGKRIHLQCLYGL